MASAECCADAAARSPSWSDLSLPAVLELPVSRVAVGNWDAAGSSESD